MTAIKCGKMVDREGKIIKDAVIVVENGKIVAAGAEVAIPEGAEVIDASGLWVTPGLIDAHSHGGTVNSTLNEMSNPIVPDMRAYDELDTHAPEAPDVRKAGFTTINVLPGSGDLMGGCGAVVKLKKDAQTPREWAVYGKEIFKMALGENPMRCYGTWDRKLPFTRMGNMALIRRTFQKALNYMKQKENGTPEPVDPQMEVLEKVLKGEMRVHIHCHQDNDIVNAVELCHEYGLNFTLGHVSQGQKVASYLAENKVLCVVGPIMLPPVKKELEGLYPTLPGVLEKAGVEFALTADAAYGIVLLPMAVGRAVGLGMSWETGIKSITINAARALDLEDRIGSLEPGKDADIAFFDGDPLLNLTHCVGTMIDGELCERSF